MTKPIIISFLLILFITITNAQNNCLDFDGTDDKVTIPNSSTLQFGSGDFTIEAWIKNINSTGSAYKWKRIFTKRGTASQWYSLALLDNSLILELNGYNFGGGPVIQGDGKWHHVAAVRTGTTIHLYIDGIKYTGTSTNYSINTDNNEVGEIGKWYTEAYGGQIYKGKIDEIRLWNDARTDAEIRGNMYQELNGTEANLVAYYNFNEVTGSILNDQSLNTNNGTWSGTGGYNTSATWLTSSAFAGSKNCLVFDGTNDFVNIGTGPASLKTLEFWINPTTTSEYIIDLDGGTHYIWINSGTITSTGFVSPTIYVNGLATTTIISSEWQHITVTTSTSINASNLTIGKVGSNDEFDGKIDEIRIWEDVRTEQEIRENMCKNIVGNESGLVGYYNFDNTLGIILQDFSTNANDGTLTNMDSSTDWVSSSAFTTWLNVVNSTWNTTTNWSNGTTPSISDNVGIPNYSGGNQPTISSTVLLNNLVVGSGSSLTVSSNTLTIMGNILNEGTILINGTLTNNGTSSVFINNGTFTNEGNTTLKKIIVNPNKTVNVQNSSILMINN